MIVIREELILVLKAQQWEKCKGELRALVALAGAHQSTYQAEPRWLELEVKINDFMNNIEDEGLQE